MAIYHDLRNNLTQQCQDDRAESVRDSSYSFVHGCIFMQLTHTVASAVEACEVMHAWLDYLRSKVLQPSHQSDLNDIEIEIVISLINPPRNLNTQSESRMPEQGNVWQCKEFCVNSKWQKKRRFSIKEGFAKKNLKERKSAQ